jgi:AmmeMemoRadiSam system protein A
VEPKLPLYRAAEEVARKAAFEDPRFPPLVTDEASEVEIEISVLSPLEEVRDIDRIEVGKHGLVIEAGMRRGLLLPHVATEYNWSREEFLNHTALKAGLAPESWKDREVQISMFTANTFSESELYELH